MKRVFLVLLTIFLLSSAIVAGIVWQKVQEIDTLTLNINDVTEFNVKKGESLYKVVEQLGEYADIDLFSFKIWRQLHPESANIKSGVYALPANVLLVDALDLLSSGNVKQLSVTLIEGQTISQWINTLATASGIKHNIDSKEALYEQLDAAEYEFCANDYASVEGCLLPETYFYTHGTSSISILERAFNAMHVYITAQWPLRFTDIPIDSQYDALILASIIEKETAIESERTEVAGVFINRLNQNMRLQTDPTVIYGVGDSYDGDITRKHLRTPTPYNTYVIKGLPITPIAMPNKASIKATLFPAITDSLYFVATGNGGHQFSTNLRDHNKAVRNYLAQRKRNTQQQKEVPKS